MKLTNEQKKRLIIGGAIFVVSAIVLKKTYDHGFKNGHIQGFDDALHIPHEAYEEKPIIAKEVDGKVVIGVDDLNTYFTWNDSKGTLHKSSIEESAND